jgi:prepilin-type N-terminal cleavage/methylation domain-containing protein
MRRQAGFSLLELVVAIIIFGLIAGMSIPFLHTFVSNYRLKGAISTLRGDFNKAKSLARANRVAYSVVFTGTTTYEIQDDAGNVVSTKTYESGVSGPTSGNATFDPVGRASSTAASFQLTNTKGDAYQISVTLTGLVQVS